jgi:hypothetical protein
MEDPHVQAIKDIIRSIPKDKIMSFKEAIDISFHLLPLSPGIQFSSKVRESIKETIQTLERRYIEDVITVQSVLPISIRALEQQTGIPMSDEGTQLVEIFTDELRKLPGDYLVQEPEDLQSLVFRLIESNASEEIAICNSEPDALLLDTDLGLANIGMMAMINKNSEVESSVYQTRNRMAVIRKNRK